MSRFVEAAIGNPGAMIARLRSVVLDTKNPQGLAEFYADVLGGQVKITDSDWVVVMTPDGTRLAFQRSPQHQPPRFPDPKGSQQFHLDIHVDDITAAEREVLALGAVRIPDVGNEGPNDPFRVFRDPAGHTFCLTWDNRQDDGPVDSN
jgi:catechol 2,3-dioxygenase-like lactoylglutathione lyase family enzyme